MPAYTYDMPVLGATAARIVERKRNTTLGALRPAVSKSGVSAGTWQRIEKCKPFEYASLLRVVEALGWPPIAADQLLEGWDPDVASPAAEEYPAMTPQQALNVDRMRVLMNVAAMDDAEERDAFLNDYGLRLFRELTPRTKVHAIMGMYQSLERDRQALLDAVAPESAVETGEPDRPDDPTDAMVEEVAAEPVKRQRARRSQVTR